MIYNYSVPSVSLIASPEQALADSCFLLAVGVESHPAVPSTMGCPVHGSQKEQGRKELWQCLLQFLFSFVEA